jgi:hypothetical protein
MNVCIDWLAENAYSGREPQCYGGEGSEDPEELRYAIDTYEIEEESPGSLEVCKKEVQSLLRRCEEAGIIEYCYETLGPVLDRLGFIY